MEINIDTIYQEALNELERASTLESVESLSVNYLGRKGRVTGFLRNVSQLPPEERPVAGKRANEVKNALETALNEAICRIEKAAEDADEGIDVTLPGRTMEPGSLHPLTKITMEICDIFTKLGFEIVEGPEIETDY